MGDATVEARLEMVLPGGERLSLRGMAGIVIVLLGRRDAARAAASGGARPVRGDGLGDGARRRLQSDHRHIIAGPRAGCLECPPAGGASLSRRVRLNQRPTPTSIRSSPCSSAGGCCANRVTLTG